MERQLELFSKNFFFLNYPKGKIDVFDEWDNNARDSAYTNNQVCARCTARQSYNLITRKKKILLKKNMSIRLANLSISNADLLYIKCF
jgi:hypothetical protein